MNTRVSYLKHEKLKNWIKEVIDHVQPDDIYLCDGSKAEYDLMCDKLVKKGTFIKLDEKNGLTAMLVFQTRATLPV